MARDASRPLPSADGFPSSAGNPVLAAKYNNHVSPGSASGQPGSWGGGQEAAAAAPSPAPVELDEEALGVLASLRNVMTQLEAQGLRGAETRKVADGNVAVDELEGLWRSGAVSSSVRALLVDMGAAAREYGMTAALKAHTKISSAAWDTHKSWLKRLKHPLILGQKRWGQ